MFRLFPLLVVALLLAGCASSPPEEEFEETEMEADASTTEADASPTRKEDKAEDPVERAIELFIEGDITGPMEMELNSTRSGKWARHHAFLDPVGHVYIDLLQSEGHEPHGTAEINRTAYDVASHDAIFDPAAEPYGTGSGMAHPAHPRYFQVEVNFAMLSWATPASVEDDEVEGVPATRYEFREATLWLEKEAPGRVLRVLKNATMGLHDLMVRYGDRAGHPLLPGLVRAEALIMADDETRGEVTRSDVHDYTWTALATGAKLRIPLDELEVRMARSSGVDLSLPLGEQASAEGEDARVTFEDVDGDGNLSPGDTLRAEMLDTDDSFAGWSLLVVDERGLTLDLI